MKKKVQREFSTTGAAYGSGKSIKKAVADASQRAKLSAAHWNPDGDGELIERTYSSLNIVVKITSIVSDTTCYQYESDSDSGYSVEGTYLWTVRLND